MRGIQSIDRAGHLLAALAALGEPAGLREIAEASGFAPAQAHAYLVSLRRAGLVEQDAAGRYGIGALAVRLGSARLTQHPTLARACALAADLAGRLGLLACVVVWGPAGPTVAEVHEGGRPLDLNLRPGTRFSVTGTASGRLFAACHGEPAVQARMEREIAAAAPGARAALAAELARIRLAGYARALGRPILGLNAVAAPVRDGGGAMVAAVTLVGAEERLPLHAQDPALAALLAAVAGAAAGAPTAPPAVRRAAGA